MKILLTVCLLAFGLLSNAQTSGYKVGDAVSDFSLKNVNGKEVSLADYKSAKGFIVVFTCNTCPVAQAYEQRIIALNNKYQAQGYPVIAINPNDSEAAPGDSYSQMQERAKQKGYTFPYLLDPGHIITKKFGASRTPHLFILQKTSAGNVVQYIGAIDNDTEGTSSGRIKYAEDAVDALASGKKPAVTTTKAVGCTIKWKKG